MSQAISWRMMGWPVWSLCQMAVVRARTRWMILAVTPRGGVAAVAFEVEWPLKVSLTDSMIWRSGLKKWANWGAGKLG